jgi:DNA repair protein RadC
VSGSDRKTIAAALLARFGSLRGVLTASRGEVRRTVPGQEAVAAHLGAVRRAMMSVLRSNLDDRPIIDGGRALGDYLRFVQGSEQVEVVRILYLNLGKRLLREEVAARGTVDEAPVYVREIVRRALELGATGLVLVHNHPSGDASPSRSDLDLTRRLAAATGTMGVTLFDHMIVTSTGCLSFRAEGLL